MPLTDLDLQSKLEELATATLGKNKLRAVSAQLWKLESAPNLHSFAFGGGAQLGVGNVEVDGAMVAVAIA